jgi:hypothetical protein
MGNGISCGFVDFLLSTTNGGSVDVIYAAQPELIQLDLLQHFADIYRSSPLVAKSL